MTEEDRAMRSATRRLAFLTAGAVTLVLVVVGCLVLATVLREQRGEGDRLLARAVQDVDDIGDQPAGVAVWQRRPDGTERRSAGAPSWLPLRRDVAAVTAGGPARVEHDVRRAGTSYRLRTERRSDGTVAQAAWSGEAQTRETGRLVTAVVLAELVGLALSAGIGLLLARRAIAPLALSMARQRRFVADASHELRTPLTLLTTRAQLLERALRRLEAPGPHAQSEALVGDARRLGDVVSDLLLSATLTEHPQRNEPVDLRLVARQSVADQAPHAAGRGVTLRGPGDDVATGPAVVLGAASALRRVVDALVDNAVGHVPDGGRVTVSVRSDASSVLLLVTDDGPGIDPAVAPRLFERFAHSPGAAGHGARAGFGIGLALVREVVEAHGGTVTGRDGAERGAVFEVRLPASPGHARPRAD
ncbi:MAG: HAMP domain-containing sensor histidine kinase [Sporichthyaceae bacterium]